MKNKCKDHCNTIFYSCITAFISRISNWMGWDFRNPSPVSNPVLYKGVGMLGVDPNALPDRKAKVPAVARIRTSCGNGSKMGLTLPAYETTKPKVKSKLVHSLFPL
mmetsp:Transcript_6904/g.42136  ORF Transcript_6904/g.42136 Transcript_6904/m.42136 type:complete len:106 (+) Transcript_6904:717-1034(+)